jgi:hypothetical protein
LAAMLQKRCDSNKISQNVVQDKFNHFKITEDFPKSLINPCENEPMQKIIRNFLDRK